MELRIRDSKGFIDVNFGYWLLPKIQSKLISNIDQYKLERWDNYLTNSKSLKRLYTQEYKAENIILFAANNLVCDGADGEITIHFNNTKLIPGFDRLLLNTLIKTVNYGTLDTKGCPIFTETFNYFAQNIDSYVRLYYML